MGLRRPAAPRAAGVRMALEAVAAFFAAAGETSVQPEEGVHRVLGRILRVREGDGVITTDAFQELLRRLEAHSRRLEWRVGDD